MQSMDLYVNCFLMRSIFFVKLHLLVGFLLHPVKRVGAARILPALPVDYLPLSRLFFVCTRLCSRALGMPQACGYVFAGRGLSEVDGEADVELAAGEVVGDGILDVVHVGYPVV